MRRKFRKFKELPFREKLLLLEAFLLQLWVGLLLKIIPFRWIPRVFSSRQPSVSSRPSGDIELLKKAIQRAGRISPWKNRCLVSSLAGRCMFRRRKISSQISLGVAIGQNGQVIAHAWLKSGHFEIIEKGPSFNELYLF